MSLRPKPIIHGRDHMPGGADPIPGLPTPTGDDIADIILGLGPSAFWKLDEASGNIAHDSSGNLNDLTADVGGGWAPPSWGQAAGPPGRTTAHWGTSTTRVSSSVGDPMTGFSNNFTAGVWVQILGSSSGNGELLGQGTGGFHAGNGWCLIAVAGTFAVMSGGSPAYANIPFAEDTWYFVACVRDAGTFKLYINGLLQTDTDTTSPGTVPGTNTWLGNDGFSAHTSYLHDGDMSFGFILDDVLTSTELLAIYEAGGGNSIASGYVWTADGDGGADWEPNLTSIAKAGDDALTGDVTLSEGTGVTLTQVGQDIEVAASGGSGIAVSIIDAKGDLIVGSANDAVDNLGVGTNDFVLTADSGQTLGVKWAALPTGAAAGSALVLLHTLNLSGAGTFDQASISGAYNDLVLVAICRGTNAAAAEGLQWNFNNDSAANYYTEYIQYVGTGAVSGSQGIGTTGLLNGRCPGNTGLASSFGVTQLTIFGYASTAWKKASTYESFSANNNTSTNVMSERGGGLWNSTAALTRVQLQGANTANLASGSQLRIYGRL